MGKMSIDYVSEKKGEFESPECDYCTVVFLCSHHSVIALPWKRWMVRKTEACKHWMMLGDSCIVKEIDGKENRGVQTMNDARWRIYGCLFHYSYLLKV